MIEITSYLNDAKEILFMPNSANGYWDDNAKKIGESLYCDKRFNWNYHDVTQKRYGLFTISLLILGEELKIIDLAKYNGKIVDYCNKIISELNQLSLSELTYGGLLASVLAYKRGYIRIDESEYENILVNTLNVIPKSYDNQFYLGLIAAKYYLDVKKSPEIESLLKEVVSFLIKSYTKKAFFNTGDPRGIYHQRRMYILWSLLVCSDLCYKDEIDKIVQHSLKYSLQKCRDGKDSAFLWHPVNYITKYKSSFKIPIRNYKSSRYLFECHQTFFCNAALLHQHFIGSYDYSKDIDESISWIFGENRIRKNLVELTNINIPNRIMTTEGELLVEGEMFKGSYEVGSYVLALSFLNK